MEVEHVIRDAGLDDAGAIGAVVVRAWQAAYRGIMPDDYLDGLRAEERAAMWHGWLSDLGPDRRVRVLTVGDEPVGFASCGPELAGEGAGDGRTGELYAINLHPALWGRGLGRALLADATRVLTGSGYRTAVLWVATGNERARRLYESEGWTVDGPARDAEVLGVTVNEVRYRRRLDV